MSPGQLSDVPRRLGLTIPVAGVPLLHLAPTVRLAEDLGFDDLWSEEATGTDGITPLAFAAAHTERVRLVTGIVSPSMRGIALLAQTAAALNDLSGGRFVLGLGSSSKAIVEDWNGFSLGPPISTMRDAIKYLQAAFSGERVRGGFRLNPTPRRPVPIIVAALRSRMLQLAAELADGAFSNFLPISGVKQVVETFGDGQKELACRCFSFLGPEEEALAAASRLFVAYGSVPGYAAFFRWLGWAEHIDPMASAWESGERRRALELVPEELVREIFLIGPFEAQRERINKLHDAGINTAVLALYGKPNEIPAAIEAFAPR